MEELIKHLYKNKKIEIEKLLPNKKIKRYKTAFYSRTQEELQFFIPKENSTNIKFLPYEIVKILIYTKEGVYTFKTNVLKCGTKILRLELPKNYKKIQRRGLLRAEYLQDAIIEYIKDNQKHALQTKIINISGSGVSFNTNEDLLSAEKALISFELEEKIIKTYIRIIEIRKNLRENIEKYRISAQFESLNNHEMEHIIKYCIKHQIKTLKKK